MSQLGTAFRFVVELLKHPVVQAGLKHAIRGATVELVHQVNRSTRTKPRTTLHFT